MTKVNRAFINREIISWGRERQGFSVEELAAKVSVKNAMMTAWESGDALPTFQQARKLSKSLRIPFGYLYLSQPPILDAPLPDLRTVPGTPPATPSPDLFEVMADVLLKQQWYRDHLEADETISLPFIGTFKAEDSTEDITSDIQARFGIDNEMRRGCSSWTAFLTLFVRKVEAEQILVMRSGIVGNNVYRKLDVKEFRGFVVSDDLAPLIFINTRDSVAARIFTLAHEIAHLWIGVSGVSRSTYDQTSDQTSKVNVEEHCDSVAAALLMPKSDFNVRWQTHLSAHENAQSLAAFYRVSTLAVLRRALDQEFLEDTEYRSAAADEISQHTTVGGDGGGDFYNNLLAKNGNLFTTTLMTAVLSQQVSFREAAQLLAVNPSTVRGAARHIFGAGVA